MNVSFVSLTLRRAASQPQADEPALTEVEPAALATITGGWSDEPPWCGTHPPGWHPPLPLPVQQVVL
jgi:hypothetical protein